MAFRCNDSPANIHYLLLISLKGYLVSGTFVRPYSAEAECAAFGYFRQYRRPKGTIGRCRRVAKAGRELLNNRQQQDDYADIALSKHLLL
jgi:hypothetical protein